MEINIKKSLIGKISTLSGAVSLISAHSVFHLLVMSTLSLLAISGVVVTQMPSMFLLQYHTFFWAMAITSFVICVALYLRDRKCMRKEMVLANAGFVIVGIPFLEQFSNAYLIIGLSIVSIAVLSYLNCRFLSKNKAGEESAAPCQKKGTPCISQRIIEPPSEK